MPNLRRPRKLRQDADGRHAIDVLLDRRLFILDDAQFEELVQALHLHA